MTEKKENAGIKLDRRKFLQAAAATGVIAPITAGAGASAPKTAKKSWKDKPDPIPENLITDAGKFDVVVVGAGTAGLLCARIASMNGASVAVIEDQTEEKFTHFGGEVGTVNSQYALKHGAPLIDEEDFIREYARRHLIRHNPKRTSYFARNSGRILDWVIKDLSPDWMAENAHVMSCPPKPNVLLEVSGWKFYYGTTIFRKMTDAISTWRWCEVLKTHQVKSLADGAKWFFGHHAEICDVDSTGGVTGVVAKRADGKYFRFNTNKGVALCAGDFAGDKEMIIDILDQLRHEAEAMGDLNLVQTASMKTYPRDGSSIKLGIWAGGHIEIGPHSTMGSGEPGCGAWHLQLDSNGERFCDEASGTTMSVPLGGVVVTLMDANCAKVIEMMPPRHGAADTAHTINWPARLKQIADLKPGPPAKTRKPSGEMSLTGGPTYCANTIEELLDYIGCYEGETKKKALAEIARYNEVCKKGVDEAFGKDPNVLKVTALKDPPFYASVRLNDRKGGMGRGVSPGLCATTGLDTDGDGRVLNSEFRPIKNLYAAGNNAGNRYITVYQSPIAGISLGQAMTEGYKLGEMLAKL